MPAARRSATAHAIGKPLLDGYRPSLLDPGLYHADGQMDGEVYNYGSFLQSKMYAAGVTCSNCHEPHSLKLRAEGNAVCAQCHLPSAFDTAAHHFHTAGQPGSRCVDCHMPAKTYMVVDPRHDHGFRVPRPDLDHQDRVAGCLRELPCRTRIRRGPRRGSRSGTARTDGASQPSARRWRPTGPPDRARRSVWSSLPTIRHAPAIARATAVAALEHQLDEPPLPRSSVALADPDALVRLAAVGSLADVDPRLRAQIAVAAASTTRSAPCGWTRRGCWRRCRPSTCRTTSGRSSMPRSPNTRRRRSTLLDRPEGLMTLANFYRDRGRPAEAEARYHGRDPSATRRSRRPTPTSPTSCASRVATTMASACSQQGMAVAAGEPRAAITPTACCSSGRRTTARR